MRILLVCSKTKTRQTLRTMLEQHSFVVDIEIDFKSALISACVHPYQLAVIEHTASKFDAAAFSSELRERGCIFPVFVIASEFDREAGRVCLDKGADDFIRHPVCLLEFMSRLRSLLRRPSQIRPDEINCGSLRIDRRRKTVFENDKEIKLTRKQFAVLEILALHEGATVSKEEIIEHTWGESEGSFLEHALETHICGLRKKLRKFNAQKIQNLIGRGYRLN